MDSLIKTAIQLVYQTFFNRIRLSTIKSIKDGDVSLAVIKQQLEQDFEKIHRKLDRLMDADIHASNDFLLQGLLLLDANDEVNAHESFKQAMTHATVGFRKTTSFTLKILAIKIKILSTLHLHYYFDAIDSPRRDFVKIESLLLQRWQQLIQETEVTSAIRDEYEGSIYRFIGSRSNRQAILLQVNKIKHSLQSLFPPHQNKFQIQDSRGKEIIMEMARIISFKGHENTIEAWAIGGGRLYSGSDHTTIKVWDISNETIPSTPIATLSGHGVGILSLAIGGGRLYSGSEDKTIKVWDISNETIPSTPIATLSGHDDGIWSLAIGGGRLYCGIGNGELAIRLL